MACNLFLSHQVSDFIGEDGDWDFNLMSHHIWSHLLDYIRVVPPPSERRGSDSVKWQGSNDGCFSI